MRLSLSTRGWDALDWSELVDMAAEMGFGGIEAYDPLARERMTGPAGPLNPYHARATSRELRGKGLVIPTIDSSIDISETNEAHERAIDEAKRMVDLAAETRTPCVCVKAARDADDQIRAAVDEILPYAIERDVCILIETSGAFADTHRLTRLLDAYASDNLAALWDVHHPYRDAHEEAATTVANLGAYIRHVHLRDSDDDGTYNLVGEGTLPIDAVMRALSSINYDGFVSMEWKPEWMPDLTDPEILLPHFVNFMRTFRSTRTNRGAYYPNHDGTGQYLWKRDELIDLTFPEVLDRLVEAFPDQYAFKYTTLDYTRTYEEFRQDVDDFARALVSLGVKPGSKVAIWATNVPAWFVTFWAATKIGAVLVTVNTAYKIHEAEYLLRQSDTHTLVMIERALDSDYAAIINELCPEIADSKPGEPLHCERLPFLRNVITVGFDMPGCLEFDEAMQRSDAVPLETVKRLAADVRPDDVCNMQYTSGTTGFPKGVMLTHRNVVNDGKCIGDRMGLSTADRMMIQVPMFHCFGMVLSMTASMTHGTTMCPMPYFSAKASLSCITQERITCFNGVPTMFIAMFNHPDYDKTDFSAMRTGIMAGSGCPPELMKRAAEPSEMNMTGIVSVYGQTESAPGSTMSAWTDGLELRTETVGYAFPHIECKVIDPETGEEVPDGVDGEFCSRGYNTMKGYYKMPDATAETVDADRWLHSGDLARRNADGTFVITGRLKDMIIRGGENIYPKEIEEFIYTHPQVQDVQVIGVPDAKYDEEIMAVIVPKEGEAIDEGEMKAFIAASLARHKVPRYYSFVDAFPMNAAGKVLKYKMREQAIEDLGLGNLVR